MLRPSSVAAVVVSILMSLIVENIYGVWPLSWTLTWQALQWLRAPEAMPDKCTIHAGTQSSDRLCCAARRRGSSGFKVASSAPCQTKPQTWKLHTVLSDS